MNGEFLGNRRTEIGISQNELSSILGYSPQLISLWESGKSSPSLGIWSKYASTLKLDLEGFLSGKIKKDNDYCDAIAFDVVNFSSTLKSLRKEKGLSQKQLAEKVSANDKTISKWESGASLPSYQQFLKLCELYGLSYDELYFSLNRAPAPVKASKLNKLFIIIPSIIALASISANAYFLVDKYNPKRSSQESSPSSSLYESSPSSFPYFDDTYHWELDKNNNKINVSEHRLESSISKDPTCVEYGEREYHCLECSYTRRENIDPLGHTHNGSWYATEEAHYHICTIDGEHFDTGNHEFDGGVIHGYTVKYTCKICGYAKEKAVDHGVLDGETYFYGDYPQTVVDDNDTIESLNSLSSPEDNGYYLYKNNYYQKAETHFSSNRYRSLSFNYFSNYSTISDNTTYWFKVEPIEWYVLSKSDNECLLLSKLIIDSKDYDYPNSVNYKESNIREFLNNDFYSKAFFKDDSKIIVSEVDNSLESTTMSFNPNTCENTFDKVFLPSVKDLSSAEYGLGTTNYEKRIAIASDYSRASLEDVYDEGMASYWTRTPTKTSAGSYCFYCDGLPSLSIGDVSSACEFGIRPMIKISI